MTQFLHIGTCSWKYDSWRGLVYSGAGGGNYLSEYSQRYDCVEVDQWFWSLFGPDKVVLPQAGTVQEYADSVPETFRFAIKMPNALTLSHFQQARKGDALVPNPHFLSPDLLNRFMERLKPMSGRLGPLMFQFGYLNKQMMPARQIFLEKLDSFTRQLPAGNTWCIETRNPNYMNDEYFRFLRDRGLTHVWLQGYYMPPIFDGYARYADLLAGDAVIRLHGPDREGMEERSGKDWSKIVEARDADLDSLAVMLKQLKARRRRVWVFVNNHFEGSAPITIGRILERLGA